MAQDCRFYAENQWTVSTADLTRTPLKFATSPYLASGFADKGSNQLYSNKQKMTIRSKGWCGFTYFAHVSKNWGPEIYGDNHPEIKQHLLHVTF